ncbi:MAG: hypothetical protein HC780_16280 [Leptolyngbyaceae cyanobacterium CSU_1_3]|nr:hypothetical protein [Leptolyngbyaceae cyanobacterium CSU_1_3]
MFGRKVAADGRGMGLLCPDRGLRFEQKFPKLVASAGVEVENLGLFFLDRRDRSLSSLFC